MFDVIITTLANVIAKLQAAKADDGRISIDEWGDILGDLGEVMGVIVRHLQEQRKAKRAARGGDK